jgi:hypothetical protein
MEVGDTPGLKALAAAASALAREVTAGKFPTVEEAAKGIDERLTAAEEAGDAKPAGAGLEAKAK